MSVSPDPRNPRTQTLNLLLPYTRLDVQPKEWQKSHWKVSHKAPCPENAALNQRRKESPEENRWSNKRKRWVNAWTPTIYSCLPMALDLANNEYGRHETHAYVPSVPYSKFTVSEPTPSRSLVMFMDHTGLDGDHQSYKVGISASLNTSVRSLICAIA